MSNGAQIDYEALAKQAGAIHYKPPQPLFDMSKAVPIQGAPLFDMSKAQPIDYAALAKQAGAIAYQAPSEPELNLPGEAGFPTGEPGNRIGPKEIAAAGIIASPVLIGAGAAALSPITRILMASAPAAAKAFNEVESVAGDKPIDVSGPQSIALRAYQLAKSGSQMPKVLTDFLNRNEDLDRGPLTFSQARDFYSNATRLASGEYANLTPKMQRQVSLFAHALNDSLEEGAEAVGKLSQYRNAMQEYAAAMTRRGFVADLFTGIKSKLPWAGAIAAGTAAGSYLTGKLSDLLGR